MTRIARLAALVLVVAAGVGLGACESTMMSEDASLYDRMGGEDKIGMVVAQFVANMNTDPGLNGYFVGADMNKVRTGMTEQFCHATGGPCEYRGRAMAAAHAGMDLSDAEFAMTQEHLRKAMAVFQIGDAEQAEFLDVYSSMKGEVAGL